MKNAELLLILLIIIIVASFVQGNILNKNKTKVIKNNLSTPTFTLNSTPTIIISPTITIYKKSSPPTPGVDAPNSNSSGQNINDYRYSNSSVKEESGNRLSLESSDDPNAITNWYKEKLKSQNMNVNSFVTTSSNGNILNKLVSANGSIKISVEILRKSSDNTTEINVKISS